MPILLKHKKTMQHNGLSLDIHERLLERGRVCLIAGMSRDAVLFASEAFFGDASTVRTKLHRWMFNRPDTIPMQDCPTWAEMLKEV